MKKEFMRGLGLLFAVNTLGAGLSFADGPFGLEMGMTTARIEEISGAKLEPLTNTPFLFMLKKVPKPHSGFEAYAVQVLPQAGLCQIRALGRDVQTSSHGLQLQVSFHELVNTLKDVYGSPEVVDKLLPGSIWKEPQDWMMGLLKHERYLSAEWKPTSEGTLKGNVKQVGLEARAKSQDEGYLFLQYSFQNHDSCESELKAKEKDAL